MCCVLWHLLTICSPQSSNENLARTQKRKCQDVQIQDLFHQNVEVTCALSTVLPRYLVFGELESIEVMHKDA